MTRPINCPWCDAPCVLWEQSMRSLEPLADGEGAVWVRWLCGTSGYDDEAKDRTELCEKREETQQ
jgi:hypothetical protein